MQVYSTVCFGACRIERTRLAVDCCGVDQNQRVKENEERERTLLQKEKEKRHMVCMEGGIERRLIDSLENRIKSIKASGVGVSSNR
jgi:hypothetical protein